MIRLLRFQLLARLAVLLGLSGWLPACTGSDVAKSTAPARIAAWTVPSGKLPHRVPFTLQARIAPLSELPRARVRVLVSESEFRVEGASSFVLGDLQAPTSPPASRPPSPPALGITVLRRFTLVPLKRGRFSATVQLESDAGEVRFEQSIEVVSSDR